MVSQHDEPATKGDLLNVSTELDTKLNALDTKLNALDTKLTAANKSLSTELDAKFTALDTKLTVEIGRVVGVVVEQLSAQWRAVMTEGVDNRFESLEHRLTETETRLSERIGLVQRAVGENSDELRQLRAEVAIIRLGLDRRDARLDDLERRISIVEKRLGIR